VSHLFEAETALVFSAVEEHLEEGQNANLLLQVSHLLHNGREPRDVVLVALHRLSELCDLTTAQSHQQVVKPLEVAPDKTHQDFFVELNIQIMAGLGSALNWVRQYLQAH